MYGVAVFDLWGSMGLLWLRSASYGALAVSISMYGAAVPDLWG